MNILSINFGHDASFCFFADGKLLDFHELERETRRKHHSGIPKEFIEKYLLRIGKTLCDVDLVVTSATQYWPFDHCDEMRIEFGSIEQHKDLFGNPESWISSNFIESRRPPLKTVDKEKTSFYMNMLLEQGLTHSPSWHRKNSAWDQNQRLKKN